MAEKLKIKTGDRVMVTTGRERGKSGEVIRVMPKEDRVLVQGINMVKRHTRPSQMNPGGIVDKEASIHISNLALEDKETGKPTRVGFKTLEDGRKVRFSKRSGETIDG